MVFVVDVGSGRGRVKGSGRKPFHIFRNQRIGNSDFLREGRRVDGKEQPWGVQKESPKQKVGLRSTSQRMKGTFLNFHSFMGGWGRKEKPQPDELFR